MSVAILPSVHFKRPHATAEFATEGTSLFHHGHKHAHDAEPNVCASAFVLFACGIEDFKTSTTAKTGENETAFNYTHIMSERTFSHYLTRTYEFV